MKYTYSMDKKHKVFFSCLAGSIALGILVPYFAFAHKGYVRPDSESRSWMSHISDSTSIDMISMPGTHDSGALHSLADVAGKCQDLSIKNQLEIGARYLDVRLQSVANTLSVCHGPINEDLTLKNVLSDCRSFLMENETEAIVLSVKEEEKEINSTISFEDALLNELKEYKDVLYLGTGIPTMQMIRGKICLMSRYANNSIGIDSYAGWGDSCTFDMNNGVNMHIQDTYYLSNVEQKKEQIKECLEYSTNYANSHTEDVLTLNFFSGYLSKGFPPSYSVPVAKEINKWALDTLPNYDATGIAIFDFLNKDLAKAVWSKNL